MTKAKTTKRALLASVLSMALCLTMLVGSTFAWFTDSVTSGKNRIVAGNLDVELYYKNASTDDWENASAADVAAPNFFVDKDGNDILWEPGVMAYTYFKATNEGSLALKYKLTTTVDDCNTLDGHDLSEVIKFVVLDGQKDLSKGRDSEVLADLNYANFDDFNPTGNLAPKPEEGESSDIFTVVAYWKPNVEDDNLFNVKNGATVSDYAETNKNYLWLDIGVRLDATQDTVESDSFDNQYDDGLYPPDEDGSLKRVLEDKTVLYYLEDGEVYLYDTQNVSIGEDGVYTVPAGVTTIGVSSFRYNSDIKEIVLSPSVNKLSINAFRGTSAERIVLNEGLTSIGERVFRDANNLKSVVIPSTVTKIEKMAFQLCGLTELTIPATVTTIEEGAFRDMPNLKKLTIEGNPTIANFAGRTCKNLETVILTGDNVTFTGTSQVFTHADSGDATGITIYVVNETVKDRLIAAQTTARGYTVEVVGG